MTFILWKYERVPQLQQGLGHYFAFYNETRLHHSSGYQPLAAVYQKGSAEEKSAG